MIKKKIKFRLSELVLVSIAVLICLSLIVAFTDVSKAKTLYPTKTNVDEHNYSHEEDYPDALFYDNGKGYTRVEYGYYKKKIFIEKYSYGFKLLSKKKLRSYLEKFEGVFTCDKYNYALFTQDNPYEKDKRTFMRIVKYDKNWNEKGYLNLINAGVKHPVAHGGSDVTEFNGHVYIHTCCEMYKSANGKVHQANRTFEMGIDEINTEHKSKACRIGVYPVSHSLFNHYVTSDSENRLVLLDLGDISPRGQILTRCYIPPGKKYADAINDYPDIDVEVEIAQQYLGVSGLFGSCVNGLEATSTGYLAVGKGFRQDSAKLSRKYDSGIFVTFTDKNKFGQNKSKIKWLTKYTKYSPYTVGGPWFVKINENKYAVLFTISYIPDDNDTYPVGMKVVYLDKNGNVTKSKMYKNALASICKPYTSKGGLIWYREGKNEITFYKINAKGKLTKKKMPYKPYQKIKGKNKVVVKKGKAITLKYKAPGKITYKSSNKKVATVSSKGKLKGRKKGKTTIQVIAKTTKKYSRTIRKVIVVVK